MKMGQMVRFWGLQIPSRGGWDFLRSLAGGWEVFPGFVDFLIIISFKNLKSSRVAPPGVLKVIESSFI